jgi:hypothetical protein
VNRSALERHALRKGLEAKRLSGTLAGPRRELAELEACVAQNLHARLEDRRN